MHPSVRPGRLLRGVLLVALALAALPAPATHRVSDGDVPTLKPDEGLLLLAVDSDVDLESVRFQREKSIWNGGTIPYVKRGRTLRLFAVPAGHYTWRRITALPVGGYTIY